MMSIDRIIALTTAAAILVALVVGLLTERLLRLGMSLRNVVLVVALLQLAGAVTVLTVYTELMQSLIDSRIEKFADEVLADNAIDQDIDVTDSASAKVDDGSEYTSQSASDAVEGALARLTSQKFVTVREFQSNVYSEYPEGYDDADT